MAPIVLASTSSNVPLNEHWGDLISHQITKVMTHIIVAEDASKSSISSVVCSVKTLVGIFKEENLNSDMPDGNRLIQEVETRF